ncbi:Arc domain-containing protein [Phaeobacter piscinae]|uniref:Arc domain-containing protein n=1 Tax=Phaeobacter piscinae TaxID=1580596 RepID=UPI000C9A0D4A|nr:Arc domain-containing protein [Phaeobacter piscinae]AUQ74751.1 hypothetical protein PhaeoP71_01890 [Phaeobacter piscinae]
MEKKQFKMVIPKDVKDWLADQAKKNLRSQSQEIVLALREKMASQEVAAQK